jgi:hypothetical protein
MCAALAAARHGARVVLMQDRPVFGGNASSEIRMWIRGAHGQNNRETGIIEELELENLYRNPGANYTIWDSVLFGAVRFQENLTSLLNCTCCDVAMQGTRIASVKGWQLTTETWHTVQAELFLDCSGDSVLAPLTGAPFRIGREARDEFNESIEPEMADAKTMGLSCLIQARDTGVPQAFTPPVWAHRYPTEESFPHRDHDLSNWNTNFWWLELGGEHDSIHDTEMLRDELLKIAFGVWDHIKNHGNHGAETWALEWVGFVPGKRESRRYVGDHIVTQNDVRSEGRFDDLVAYGGWSMDDHHPAGFLYAGQPTIHHSAPSPFGLPYRALYSRTIDNLLFAGRNISATHAAMSATRVMGTCAILGQAAGTAAAIAARHALTPRGVYEHRLHELQQTLLADDCYLPWRVREITPRTRQARMSASSGNSEALRDGVDRPVGGDEHAWTAPVGSNVELAFDREISISGLRLVFDSDLNRSRRFGMNALYSRDMPTLAPPPSLVKAFTVSVRAADGTWGEIARVNDNFQRLVRVALQARATAVRVTTTASWGNAAVRVFALDCL